MHRRTLGLFHLPLSILVYSLSIHCCWMQFSTQTTISSSHVSHWSVLQKPFKSCKQFYIWQRPSYIVFSHAPLYANPTLTGSSAHTQAFIHVNQTSICLVKPRCLVIWRKCEWMKEVCQAELWTMKANLFMGVEAYTQSSAQVGYFTIPRASPTYSQKGQFHTLTHRFMLLVYLCTVQSLMTFVKTHFVYIISPFVASNHLHLFPLRCSLRAICIGFSMIGDHN